MIKIINKDSIIDIIKKIENSKDEEIILGFPIGNTILHNYTSLKILKNKAGAKNIIIITNDLNAKKIGKKLGIKYSILKDKNVIDNIDLLKYNYTFGEYLLFLIKSYFRGFKNFFSNKKDKQNNRHKYKLLNQHYLKNEKSRIGFFIIGLLVLVMIFIFIFYFAVNKTYITITPEIIIKTRAQNFIFKEEENDTIGNSDNVINLKSIEKIVYLKENFGTSGIKDSDLIKSKGKVKLVNNLTEDIPLLPNSRLETNDGLIFLIPKSITIPKAQKNENSKIIPGTINVLIIAQTYDNKGKYIGTRGNIKPGVLLSFPGLKDLGSQIYAETIENFNGGKDDYTKIVSKDDATNAKSLLEGKLRLKALGELKKEILEGNQKNNITYEILGIDKVIKYSDLKISGGENLKVGNEIGNFELSGTIKISTYIFNKDLVINKLKHTIRDGIMKNIENINYINNQSLRLANIISKQDNPFEIKITAEIEAFYSQNFLDESSNYLNKLKNNINGISVEDAKKILINDPKISDVNIETQPFFIKNISNIHNNIIFDVKK